MPTKCKSVTCVNNAIPLSKYCQNCIDEHQTVFGTRYLHPTQSQISSANDEIFHPELKLKPSMDAEKDPLGKSPHSPGAKLDSGKVQPALIIEGMARAIWAVSEIATFGAIKYTEGGWVEVPEGEKRYANAQYRHILKKAMGESVDPDSEKLHLAHEAWNALAKLDLYLRNQEAIQ